MSIIQKIILWEKTKWIFLHVINSLSGTKFPCYIEGVRMQLLIRGCMKPNMKYKKIFWWTCYGMIWELCISISYKTVIYVCSFFKRIHIFIFVGVMVGCFFLFQIHTVKGRNINMKLTIAQIFHFESNHNQPCQDSV